MTICGLSVGWGDIKLAVPFPYVKPCTSSSSSTMQSATSTQSNPGSEPGTKWFVLHSFDRVVILLTLNAALFSSQVRNSAIETDHCSSVILTVTIQRLFSNLGLVAQATQIAGRHSVSCLGQKKALPWRRQEPGNGRVNLTSSCEWTDIFLKSILHQSM